MCRTLFGDEVAVFGKGELLGNAERGKNGVRDVQGVGGEEGDEPSIGDFW